MESDFVCQPSVKSTKIDVKTAEFSQKINILPHFLKKIDVLDGCEFIRLL